MSMKQHDKKDPAKKLIGLIGLAVKAMDMDKKEAVTAISHVLLNAMYQADLECVKMEVGTVMHKGDDNPDKSACAVRMTIESDFQHIEDHNDFDWDRDFVGQSKNTGEVTSALLADEDMPDELKAIIKSIADTHGIDPEDIHVGRIGVNKEQGKQLAAALENLPDGLKEKFSQTMQDIENKGRTH